MKVRHAQNPRHDPLEDAGLHWPGSTQWASWYFSSGGILRGAPANDLEGPACCELPLETEENLRKVALEYRRLFGSTPSRQRLDEDIGRLIFGRRTRPVG